MKKFLFFATMALMATLAAEYLVPTTIEVASALKYPQTIYALRDKVHGFLDTQKIDMMLDVQDLRAKNLMYRATKQEELYTDEYYSMRDRFDREFETIDRRLLTTADSLDRQEASVKTKALIVNDNRAQAIALINALIDSYRAPKNKIS